MPVHEVPAIHAWSNNAALVADVASIHFPEAERGFDATYGLGRWWRRWQPAELVTNDLFVEAADYHYDFRTLSRYFGPEFDLVAYDPPYKLNGTPALAGFDQDYGVAQPTSWQERMRLVRDGFAECAELVAPKGHLIAKCQDQVAYGEVRWQTLMLASMAPSVGLRLKDRFDMLGGSRKQPEGRPQRHGRGRGSTLLVFVR